MGGLPLSHILQKIFKIHHVGHLSVDSLKIIRCGVGGRILPKITLTFRLAYDIMISIMRGLEMEGVETRNGLYGFDYLQPDKRRAEEGERKTYEVKGLWQRSHEIVNLAVQGFKQVEIAEILNIHPQTVSNLLNSELGQRKLSEIRLEKDGEMKKVVEKIRVLTNKAIDTYHEVFDNESGEATLKDRKDAAKDVIMELSGLRAPVKLQSSHVNLNLTAEELESFKARGIAAARESGMIIDVEAKEITEGEAE